MGDAVLTEELRTEVSGEVLGRGDPAYEEARPSYVEAGEPAIIVRPEAPDEVGRVVRYAAKQNLPISVRSGGHGAAAFANPDGLVIDLSRLDRIDVRPDGTVRIGGGATWGAVAEALAEHGLALTSGDTRSVGVGGLTLGGGIGWMVRQYGLALDSLAEAEVVLASGETVTASESENPDLFWALRGGGGNFGVVTSFTFRAHPLDGVVFGALTFGGDDLGGLVRGWRDVMRAAPEELNSTLLAMPPFGEAPPGVQVLVCWSGAQDAADAAIAPLLALPGLVDSSVGPRSYADVLEEPQKPEGPITIVDYNGFAADFDDGTVDAVLSAKQAAGPMSVLMLRYLRGAFNRVDADATAFAHRDAEVLVILAAFLPPDADASAADGLRERWTALDDHTLGMYSNFAAISGERITERIFPPATLDRLRRVKREYDPGNLFARNHNVRPAEGAAAAMPG